MKKFSLKNFTFLQIISFVLIILALLFISQNFHSVEISLVIWKFEMPLFILLVITFVIGFFAAIAFGEGRPDYEVEIKHEK